MESEDGVPVISRAVAALVGVLAAVSALAAGHLVAGAFAPHASPFLAVGNTAIDLTPEPVKAFAIREFGSADKQVLLLGMAVVIVLLAVVSGLVSRRGPLPGCVLIALFGVTGVAATLARPDLPASAVTASVVAGVIGVAVFVWLHRLAARVVADRAAESSTEDGRRRFLLSSVASAVAAGMGGVIGQFASARGNVEATRRALGPIVPARRETPVPPGADFASAGTPSFITSNRDFYRVDTALSVPEVNVDDWRLRVHGMVGRELLLSFSDLLRRRQLEKTITLTCVSNDVGGPYISTARFAGVPIRDILLEAGVRPGAEQVFSRSVDGFTAGTPVDVLLDPGREALLAVGMNGEPLPAEHGFPVRMVTPGLYGYVSATKWLQSLELTTFDKDPYWAQRGWAKRAPIKTQSRIDRPRPFDKIPAGRTTVAGIAWAQHTGISGVEVRVDGGAWRATQLSTEVSADTWRMWRIDVELPPGGHTIECRATDRVGYTQTPQRQPPAPDGATGWHSVFVTAR